MAPAVEQSYFPPVDQCLKGETILLSWKIVATALSDSFGERQRSPALIKFFQDDFVQKLLQEPSLQFSSPSPDTKSQYEARTAPASLSSSPDNSYEVQKIKRDAEWLSESCDVNLMTALRIVVVEFQSRPLQYLSGPLSSQDIAHIQDAAGFKNGQDSARLLALGTMAPREAEELWSDFETDQSARRRIFSTYLSERKFFMMACDHAHSLMLYRTLPISVPGGSQELCQTYGLVVSDAEFPRRVLNTYMKLLRDLQLHFEAGSRKAVTGLLSSSSETRAAYQECTLTEVVHSLSVILQALDVLQPDLASPANVTSWFEMADFWALADRLAATNPSTSELVSPIRSLASAISLSFLRPRQALMFLDKDPEEVMAEMEDSYLSASDALGKIHSNMIKAINEDCESAFPVALAWCFMVLRMHQSLNERLEKRDNLLHQSARETFEAGELIRPVPTRRSSNGSIMSIELLKFDTFLQGIGLDKDMQDIEALAKLITANGRVFNMISMMAVEAAGLGPICLPLLLSHRIRVVFLDFLQVVSPFVGYQSDAFSCLLSLLHGGQTSCEQSPHSILPSQLDTIDTFFRDEVLLRTYFWGSLNRFPFEFSPFARLCRALCSGASNPDTDNEDGPALIHSILRKTPTITFALPTNFQKFEFPVEEENTNTFILTQDLPLLGQKWGSARCTGDEGDFVIPAGTMGRFMSDSGRVVAMRYEHSALSLLGRRLELTLLADTRSGCLHNLQPNQVAEGIALLATLLHAEHSRSGPVGGTDAVMNVEKDVLNESSSGIGGGKDIVSVVCETMDLYLQDALLSEDEGLHVLTSCVQFLDSILPLCPGRVWSYMARSELIGVEHKSGRLLTMIGSLELVCDRYLFLLATIKFLSRMLDTAMASAVQRRCGGRVAGQRQNSGEKLWFGVADRILDRVCVAIAQVAVDTFENSTTWRCVSEMHRIDLILAVVPILHQTIYYVYSMDDTDGPAKFSACLSTAASSVVSSFLSPSSTSLRFQAILGIFSAALNMPESTSLPGIVHRLEQQLTTVANFVRTLLRVSIYLDYPTRTLESRLVKSSTLIVRLVAISEVSRQPVTELLHALVHGANRGEAGIVSLIGYLGPHISKSLLQVLGRLGLPFCLPTELVTGWRFFTSLVSQKQEWMTNYILFRKTCRTLKAPVSSGPVFGSALQRLRCIGTIDVTEALAMLEFFASTLNHHPRPVMAIQGESEIMQPLCVYVAGLKSHNLTTVAKMVQAGYEAKIAGCIAQIFAMHLFHLRHMGQAGDLAGKLVNCLDYYLRNGALVAGCNTSLHVNFARNFAKQYPGCTLEHFKRTLLEPARLGTGFFYDVDRASEVLQFDPSWTGCRGGGFRTEMEMANANLFLVDAQVSLFRAWQLLLLELSSSLDSATVTVYTLQVAHQCLEANQENQSPDNIRLGIVEDRAGLALALTQRLRGKPIRLSQCTSLINAAFGTFVKIDEPFATRAIGYGRLILRILYSCLSIFSSRYKASDGPAAEPTTDEMLVGLTQTVLNILDRVVAKGLRTVVGLIHDPGSSVLPQDVALLTALLQACLAMPNMEQSQSQVLNIMASQDACQISTSLFSWADKVGSDGDPVYAELSVLFLVEMSKLPAIAEQIASDGILGNILSANLVSFMRRTTISPASETPVIQRCYGVWARGLLPLMLNLLIALGVTIAPEVAYVLNQFPQLLRSSVDRLEAPGASRTSAVQAGAHHVTLVAISEMYSLALLTRVLRALRVNNSRDIPDVAWDAAAVLENVEFWLSSRKLLKERLLPLGQREAAVGGIRTGPGRPEDGPFESKLEERSVEQLEAIRDVLGEEPN